MSITINAVDNCSGPPESGGSFVESQCLVNGTWTEGPATFQVSGGTFATQAVLTTGPIAVQSISVYHGSTSSKWYGNIVVNIVSPSLGTRIQIPLSPSLRTSASKNTPTFMAKGDYITLSSDGGNTGVDGKYYVMLTGFFSISTNQ
jgi:hypothetical protein